MAGSGNNITVPSWVFSAIGAVLLAVFVGAIGWMNSIDGRVSGQEIRLTEVRTRQISQDETISEIKQSIKSVEAKVDHMAELVSQVLTELRVRNGTASLKKNPE